jgi:hypothetical protein
VSSQGVYQEMGRPARQLAQAYGKYTYVFSKELDGSDLPLSTIQTILIDIVHLRRHANDREIVWLAERVSFRDDYTLPWSK